MIKFYNDSINHKKNRLNLNNEELNNLDQEANKIAMINIQSQPLRDKVETNLPNDLKEIEEFIDSNNPLIEWYSAIDELFLNKLEDQQENNFPMFF